MWGAALWVYVAEREASPDDLPRRADLAAVVQALVAEADDVELDDVRFHGPDLLVAGPAVIELADIAPAEPVAEELLTGRRFAALLSAS